MGRSVPFWLSKRINGKWTRPPGLETAGNCLMFLRRGHGGKDQAKFAEDHEPAAVSWMRKKWVFWYPLEFEDSDYGKTTRPVTGDDWKDWEMAKGYAQGEYIPSPWELDERKRVASDLFVRDRLHLLEEELAHLDEVQDEMLRQEILGHGVTA